MHFRLLNRGGCGRIRGAMMRSREVGSHRDDDLGFSRSVGHCVQCTFGVLECVLFVCERGCVPHLFGQKRTFDVFIDIGRHTMTVLVAHGGTQNVVFTIRIGGEVRNMFCGSGEGTRHQGCSRLWPKQIAIVQGGSLYIPSFVVARCCDQRPRALGNSDPRHGSFKWAA